MVAMEMVIKQGNGIWEFPNPPTLQTVKITKNRHQLISFSPDGQVFSILSECEWVDYLLELEMWATLAQLALEHNAYDLVCV